ncbi:GNAT family N-acetyltransferase [Acanthopleuribacter pedis]|uniref:N-acetyltransferase domain-containing protein n=1 Tax=Acanthopleuribacter pedis TaxID=442870 RepID=A0A8J7Q7K8_9BACT|nr:GNAT family N-acetyltransferase [Acanthopleuribacter pedis]MBO1322177.1 hypothetical protein [Acanthopleuribacter pedis]
MGSCGALETFGRIEPRHDIVFEVVDQRNMHDAAALVARVFARDEPLVRFLGISEEEMFAFTSQYYPKIAAEGLSLIARDVATRAVIGARICEDSAIPAPDGLITELSPKFDPLFACLEQLGSDYFTEYQPKPGECAHMFMVAVADDYTNMGIAPRMNRLFFEMARERGYRRLVTEPTGNISQHILRDKMGFEVLVKLAYRDFSFNGEKVFASIEGHDYAMLMEKRI